MLTKALAILLAIACAIAITTSIVAHNRGLLLEAADTAHKADTDKIAELARANTANTDTIADLLGRLDRAAGVNRDVQAAADAAQAQAATNADARDKALAEARRLKGELYAHDQASAVWATGHLSDALTDRVRESWLDQARRGDSHAGGGRTAGAVRGDPGQLGGPSGAGTPALTGLPCAAGCYTNDQLLDLLDAALDSRGRCVDQLDAIARLSKLAVATNHE